MAKKKTSDEVEVNVEGTEVSSVGQAEVTVEKIAEPVKAPVKAAAPVAKPKVRTQYLA